MQYGIKKNHLHQLNFKKMGRNKVVEFTLKENRKLLSNILSL